MTDTKIPSLAEQLSSEVYPELNSNTLQHIERSLTILVKEIIKISDSIRTNYGEPHTLLCEILTSVIREGYDTSNITYNKNSAIDPNRLKSIISMIKKYDTKIQFYTNILTDCITSKKTTDAYKIQIEAIRILQDIEELALKQLMKLEYTYNYQQQ